MVNSGTRRPLSWISRSVSSAGQQTFWCSGPVGEGPPLEVEYPADPGDVGVHHRPAAEVPGRGVGLIGALSQPLFPPACRGGPGTRAGDVQAGEPSGRACAVESPSAPMRIATSVRCSNRSSDQVVGVEFELDVGVQPAESRRCAAPPVRHRREAAGAEQAPGGACWQPGVFERLDSVAGSAVPGRGRQRRPSSVSSMRRAVRLSRWCRACACRRERSGLTARGGQSHLLGGADGTAVDYTDALQFIERHS